MQVKAKKRMEKTTSHQEMKYKQLPCIRETEMALPNIAETSDFVSRGRTFHRQETTKEKACVLWGYSSVCTKQVVFQF